MRLPALFWLLVLGLSGMAACKAECKDRDVDLSVEGAAAATAGSVAVVDGRRPNVVDPGVNRPTGAIILSWQGPGLGTRLLVPGLRFGLRGLQDARALGGVLCWCPEGHVPGVCQVSSKNLEQPGVRCVELNGTLDITRHEFVDNGLGKERDVDLILDLSGADGDASVSVQLRILIKDRLFTFECDRFQDPISWLAPSNEREVCRIDGTPD